MAVWLFMNAMAARAHHDPPEPRSYGSVLARFFAALLDSYGAAFKALASSERRARNEKRSSD